MSVTENTVDFNSLEADIFRKCCALGCKSIKETLDAYDDELAQTRDRSVYRNKGRRKTVIKTVMGEVEYWHTLYETYDSDGIKQHVYLLDEAMGIVGSGFMSGLLSELIVKAACEGTYRAAARSVSELTGQSISHTAAWNVVQDFGTRIDLKEQQAAAAAKSGNGTGTIETKVLFEEQDGVHLHLQGKDRDAHGKSKEMKLAIAYSGAKKTGEKRYELTDKVACANFDGVDDFVERKEGTIASTYNVDEIMMRFLNGDGAGWIKNSITDETVHFQLDQYHVNKAIRKNVADPEMRKMITGYLYEKDIDGLLECIKTLSDSVETEEEQEKLLVLYTYFANNRDGLVPCHRRGLDIPEPPEGKTYRRMGAMESNIFSIIGNRMKGRRRCWSINGGNNLARLLCLKSTGKLADALQNMTPVVLPEKYAEEITAGLSAAKVAQSTGKGYDGYHKATAPPTPGFKWLRDIGSLSPSV